jgi:hypothetical protein
MTEPGSWEGDRPSDADTLDPLESLDSDEIGERAGDDGYDAPERWSAAERYGTTATEERDGESLDDLLAEEEPDVDPYAEAERRETGDVLVNDVEDRTVARPGAGWGDDRFGDPVGTLVEDDEGAGPDVTAELIAHEAGPENGGSPEEDALHLDTDE